MSLTNPNTPVSQQDLQDFYHKILPYMGGSSGGSGGGHTIEDAEGTDLTQRDTLQFGEGFLAEDDDTNEKTVISPDVMQSGDMSDVITPLPSVAPKKEGVVYSTTEQVIGEWIDGKPIYQKTITGISPSNAGSVGDTTNAQSYSLGANIESLIKVQGQLHRISGGYHLSYEIGTQYLDNNQFFKMWFRLNDSPENANTVAICVGSDWVNSPFYLTIQYTKTT